jgi:hypothetical protein
MHPIATNTFVHLHEQTARKNPRQPEHGSTPPQPPLSFKINGLAVETSGGSGQHIEII